MIPLDKMSGPENKTFYSVRISSEKDASKDQGSLVANGGIYIKKNIECDQNVITDKITVRDAAKIAGNISIGGTIYCPDLYTLNDDTIGFKRNLIPSKPKYPISKNDMSTLGTRKEPWEIIYVNNIDTKHIDASTISIATNCSGLSSLEINSDCININENLNIINPVNNTIMMKSSDGFMETYVPNYTQWESFYGTQITYQPNLLLQITTSIILINTDTHNDIILILNGDQVPRNTKVKIYFLKKNQSCKIQYNISLITYNKKYVFTSKIPAKKISLFFMDNFVYLIN